MTLRQRQVPADIAASENLVLVETLRLAVPLHMMELSSRTPAELVRIAQASATVVGSQGDVLQFQSPKRGASASAFNALARGLAAASLIAWGGSTFAGLHWCTAPRCPGPDADHPRPTFQPEPHSPGSTNSR